jgi:hypothetical protein
MIGGCDDTIDEFWRFALYPIFVVSRELRNMGINGSKWLF